MVNNFHPEHGAFLKTVLPTEVIQDRINKQYDELVYEDGKGNKLPFECTFCDKFLMHEDQKLQVTLKKVKYKPVQEILNWMCVPDSRRKVEIENHYKFQRQTHNDGCTSDLDWLDQLALSPRGILCKKPRVGRGQNYEWGFTSCSLCKSCIDDRRLPRHAILNKNYVGLAPKCLTDLTEVELAFLSPVKHYGYCFTWQGEKQLKGTLMFMRVEKRSVVRALTEVEALGLNENILILCNGNFTEKQKQRAKELSSFRSDKVIAAMEWLCANNKEWKGINLQKARRVVSTKEPHIINRSEDNLEDENNVEEKSSSQFTIQIKPLHALEVLMNPACLKSALKRWQRMGLMWNST